MVKSIKIIKNSSFGSYNSISSILSYKNLENIIVTMVEDNKLKCRFIDELKNILFSISDYLNSYESILLDEQLVTEYFNRYLCYSDNIINDFIAIAQGKNLKDIIDLSYIASGKKRKSVPVNNAKIPEKNLVCNFNCEKLKAILNKPLKDDTLEYVNAFLHLTILIIIAQLRVSVGDKVEGVALSVSDNFAALNRNVNFAIVTGMEFFAEFKVENVSYIQLYYELAKLHPQNKRNLCITNNTDRKIITFKILNSYLFRNAFKLEGYEEVLKLYDRSLDKKTTSEIRIMQGNSNNDIKITVSISGMRSIGRLLSVNCDAKRKVYLNLMNSEYGAIFVENMVSFCFRSVLQNCSGEDSSPFLYNLYSDFIQNYSARTGSQRGIALKSMTAILLSRLPKTTQQQLINKHFSKTDTQQKTTIYKDLGQLNLQEDVEQQSILQQLYSNLWRHYGW